MKPLLLLLVLLFVVPAIAQENTSTQSKNVLVGTWKLISATDTTVIGQVIENAYGLNPIGFLSYTTDGRMQAIITNGGRKPLSTPDWVGAPAGERAEAFATLFAYAGRYTLDGYKVTHHVEAASLQNAVNRDLIRFIAKLQGNQVTLSTMPFLKGGLQISKEELVWERIN